MARQSRGYRAHVSEIVNDIPTAKFSRRINTSGKRGKVANNIFICSNAARSLFDRIVISCS